MSIFEWNDSFVLNIPNIDEQHQRLITMISDLDAAVREGTGGLIISYVLQELTRYTDVHFEDEERLMLSYAFPGLDGHHQEHEFFVLRLKHISESFRDGDILSKETLDFLKDWISCHIKGTDQIYADFIRAETGKRCPD